MTTSTDAPARPASTSSPATHWDSGSFRDPRSRVFVAGDHVYRGLDERGLEEFGTLTAADFYPKAMADGRLVHTELATDDPAAAFATEAGYAGVLRHEKLPFVSYPYEWSFGQLKDAALLTLDLLHDALTEELTLKDGSAYNVQWRGAKPVFIDIGSFHPHNGGPWVGYLQFCQQLLYPLMLQAYRNVPFQPWMRGSLEGITPGEMRAMMSWRDYMRKGVFGHVVMHSMLQNRYDGDNTRDAVKDLKKAGFKRELVMANVRTMRKIIRKLSWKPHGTWVDYRHNNTYDTEQAKAKQEFVRSACAAHPGGAIWDLGCNDGLYSRIAAEHADFVLALDLDHGTIEHLYRELAAEGNTKILPLVSNLVDPSPGLGWAGAERVPLVDRGRPDLVLALALIHHVVISGHIPMPTFVAWLAGLGSDLVIELPTEDDPMVQRLISSKPDGHHEYSEALFERVLADNFRIVDRRADGTRRLYRCEPLR